jgi:predicted AlkP superfamily pyrophosphatase or phosphodiesterase
VKIVISFLIITVLACTKKDEKPKLVVFISIDQWRYDLLEKYKDQYNAGFKRLINEATIYSNALHNYSSTETGPGHSVLLTGNYPSKTGIVRNDFTDRKLGKYVYCVQDDSAKIVGSDNYMGISPKNLLVPTIGDILKSEQKSKVFSISGKDRSAVLMAGHKADAVFWYHSGTGKIVSSDYYMEKLPDYIELINSENYFNKYFTESWNKKFDIDYTQLSREDHFIGESDNKNTTFPHVLNEDSTEEITSRFYKTMRYTPFLDQYILNVAETILKEEKLGKSENADLLIVGLPSTDYIGHKFGPFSQETLDHLLRLDRYLGNFFSVLDEQIGKDNYLLVMSSDHGVAPVPEYSQKIGNDAKRYLREDLKEDFDKIEIKFQKKFKLKESLLFNDSISDKLSDEQKTEIVQEIRNLSYVADIFTYEELESQETKDRPFLEDYKKSFHPERSANFELLPKENYLAPSYYVGGTTHGSAHRYDKHVPIIFMGKGYKQNKISTQVETIDIAPTLAKILGLKSGTFQGKVL